jgi:hypothetical protein
LLANFEIIHVHQGRREKISTPQQYADAMAHFQKGDCFIFTSRDSRNASQAQVFSPGTRALSVTPETFPEAASPRGPVRARHLDEVIFRTADAPASQTTFSISLWLEGGQWWSFGTPFTNDSVTMHPAKREGDVVYPQGNMAGAHEPCGPYQNGVEGSNYSNGWNLSHRVEVYLYYLDSVLPCDPEHPIDTFYDVVDRLEQLGWSYNGGFPWGDMYYPGPQPDGERASKAFVFACQYYDAQGNPLPNPTAQDPMRFAARFITLYLPLDSRLAQDDPVNFPEIFGIAYLTRAQFTAPDSSEAIKEYHGASIGDFYWNGSGYTAVENMLCNLEQLSANPRSPIGMQQHAIVVVGTQSEPALIVKAREGEKVRLMIHDILGRQVANLMLPETGEQYVKVSDIAPNLPAGSYFASIEAGGEIKAAKFALVR